MWVQEYGATNVLAVVAALGLSIATASAAADTFSASATARELAGRLIAPCCWTQTLDIHDSPIADQLRTEIATRLGRGESAAGIEDDLASRYGDKIRAVPRGEDPRVALPLIVGSVMGLAVLWLAWLGVSWLRRTSSEPAPAVDAQQYDQQLDHALSTLSDQD